MIVKKTVFFDSVGEYFVECILENSFNVDYNNDFIFNPDYSKLLKRSLMAASALYSGKRIQSGYIPVKIVCAQEGKYTLFKNTCIGTLECKNSFDIVCNIENDESKSYDEIVKEILSSHHSNLEREELDMLKIILIKYKELFSRCSTDIGTIKGIKHVINTGNNLPIAQPSRRIPMHLEDKVENLIEEMLQKDIIQKAESPWNSPIVVVPKKNGTIRLCVDYRQLNKITSRPIFPIPNTKNIFDTLEGATYFSSLDLSMGYHQVEVREEDIEKTAFSTKTGQYTYKRMPFGLCSAPSTFQMVMNGLLRNFTWRQCVCYLDDVLIFGKTLKEHVLNLSSIFDALLKAGVKLSPNKCFFLRKELKFLGHVINAKGIQTDPEKTSKIKEWPIPQSNKELHSFMGLANYYRSFIKDYANVVNPLEKLLNKTKEKSSKWVWEEDHNIAFETIKMLLTSAPVLGYPKKECIFILDTDASHNATGAVLSQIQNGKEVVIEYASHTFSKHEKQYCITRKELLAVYRYVNKFKHYLLAKRFIIRTDHQSLTWLMNWKNPSTSQYCKWIAELQMFDFDIQHRKGILHVAPDALSRYPLNCGQCEIKHFDPKQKRNVKVLNEINSVCQTTDEELSKIKLAIEKISNDESEKCTLLKMLQDLCINNGDLCLKQKCKMLIIPEKVKRLQIIRQCHIDLGHVGMRQCLERLKQMFYWSGLSTDVEAVISKCHHCLCFKDKHTKEKIHSKSVKTDKPFQTISLDIAGPLKVTKAGHRYILGIVDHCTRYIMCVPLKSTTTSIVIKRLVERWISIFGFPIRIHSDKSTIFESEEFQRFCRKYQIKKTYSPPYRPQANGKIERIFKDIKPRLLIYEEENNVDWDDAVPYIELGIRNCFTRSTGLVPNEMIFKNKIRDTYSARHQINEKENLNAASDDILFKKGDFVYIKRRPIEKGKSKFKGPFEIVKTNRESKSVTVIKENGKLVERSMFEIKKSTNKNKVECINPNFKEIKFERDDKSESCNTSVRSKKRKSIKVIFPEFHTHTESKQKEIKKIEKSNLNRYPKRKHEAPSRLLY